MPRFSIIIAAYNVQDQIERCLTSVTNQTFGDFEAIVVDDASTDETPSFIATAVSKDPRIRVITHEKNQGLHLARRTGVLASSGEYGLFLDGDDELEPTLLEELSRAVIENPADIIDFGLTVVGENGIDEGERAAFEAFNNQPSPRSYRGDIVRNVFDVSRGQHIGWRITNHLFKMGLLQRAFGEMTDGRLERAEDGYESFVIYALARSFDSLKSCHGYVYHYGGGVTGTSAVSADTYRVFCAQFKACFDAARTFTEEHPELALGACLQGFVSKATDLLVNDWHVRVSDDDKLSVLDALQDAIGTEPLAAQLMRLSRDEAYDAWANRRPIPEDAPLREWYAKAEELVCGRRVGSEYAHFRHMAKSHISDVDERTETFADYERQDIRIFISTHKNVDLFDSKILQPVQVGVARAPYALGFALSDADGENISELNPMYCELTTQYWAWKNVDAKYYGFCHYRRYFDFNVSERHKENPYGEVMCDYIDAASQSRYRLDDDSIRSVVEGYDVITTEFKRLADFPDGFTTPWEQYKAAPNLHIADLRRVMDIVCEMHPDYADDVDDFLSGEKACFCNMFIMRKEVFFDYCSWLYPILERFVSETDMSHYSREAVRTPGHLAERLLNVYYNHHMRVGTGWKVRQLQTVHFEHPERFDLPTPSFSGGEGAVIPVVLAADNNYVPMLTTTIYSMLKNASESCRYDIFVLERNISWERKELMRSFLSRFPNAALSFVDVTRLIARYDLVTNNQHISIETYYRFLIQELLPFYDKVLYLDSDLIVEGDVSKLYATSTGDNLIAAVRDVDYLGNLNGHDGERMAYTRDVLKLKDPYGYFQAGVLVLNTKAMRKFCSVKDWLELVSGSEFIYDDQDVLNARCQGRVTYLDQRWNVMNDCDGRIARVFSCAPADVYDAYLAARTKPLVVHYAGFQKPWNMLRCDECERYWSYARETPFYEELVGTLASYLAGNGEHSQQFIPRAVSESNPVRHILDPLLPLGTKRREVAKSAMRAIRGLS